MHRFYVGRTFRLDRARRDLSVILGHDRAHSLHSSSTCPVSPGSCNAPNATICNIPSTASLAHSPLSPFAPSPIPLAQHSPHFPTSPLPHRNSHSRNTPAQNEPTKSATNPSPNHSGAIKNPDSPQNPHIFFDETNPNSHALSRNWRNTRQTIAPRAEFSASEFTRRVEHSPWRGGRLGGCTSSQLVNPKFPKDRRQIARNVVQELVK
jgi:hypothetical protein